MAEKSYSIRYVIDARGVRHEIREAEEKADAVALPETPAPIASEAFTGREWISKSSRHGSEEFTRGIWDEVF